MLKCTQRGRLALGVLIWKWISSGSPAADDDDQEFVDDDDDVDVDKPDQKYFFRRRILRPSGLQTLQREIFTTVWSWKMTPGSLNQNVVIQ